MRQQISTKFEHKSNKCFFVEYRNETRRYYFYQNPQRSDTPMEKQEQDTQNVLDAIRTIEKASNSYGNDLFIQYESAAK